LRSADVTQGYLHFGADELLDPASRIERAILEYAGLAETKTAIDAQIQSALSKVDDYEKRRILFELLNNSSGVKNETK